MGVLMKDAPQTASTDREAAGREVVVNDFNISIATANGTGSQTSNNVIIRSLFKLGIPVTGKNFFPSNIQGLPTWFQIRLSNEGYLARRDGIEITICMNGATVAEDMETALPGGIILYDDSLPIANRRDEVTYYAMPVKELIKQADLPFALKSYVANFVYVGVLAYLLDIDMDAIHDALLWNFGGKEKPVKLNFDMARSAYDWAAENLERNHPYRVEAMEGFVEDKILIDGNDAAALGALFNGVSFVSWYPITPSSSLAEGISKRGPKLRVDPDTGKSTYAVIQAEDELAAIGMVVGAGWAGARAMTATSGPGISLMSEFIGLAYFAEIPSVVWNIQRMGPSTGLPTRTGQVDILSTYYLSHGDTHHVLLFPDDPKECFEFAGTAFDLAERLQTPVFVLSDLDIGMNAWITDKFDYPEGEMDRGKVLSAEDLKELGGSWGRYKDVDGDGIGYRTLPGNEHKLSAYFTRGTGHNEYAIYSERGDDWEQNMARLQRKFETARTLVPKPEMFESDSNPRIGIISLGSNHPAILEARDRLAADDVEVDYLRLRALPIGQEVRDFIHDHEQVFVVEANTDGQLHIILQTEEPASATKLVSLTKCDGMPLSARWITEAMQTQLS